MRSLTVLRERFLRVVKDVDVVAIARIGDAIIDGPYRHKRYVYTCGNGGSAAIAGHLALDLRQAGQYLPELEGLRAESLCSNVSLLTDIADHYGFEEVFRKQLETLPLSEHDVLISISSRGMSTDVINATEYAKKHRVRTVGLIDAGGGKLRSVVDMPLVVAGHEYETIEPAHSFVCHALRFYLMDRLPEIERVKRGE